MKQEEVIKKIKYALELSSELPDLEFKAARGSIPGDIWKTISAFANRRGGGLIVFGVAENNGRLEVNGCENIERMQVQLADIFSDKMSFVLRPKYFIFDLQDKNMLAIFVPECPKDYMPCYHKHVGLPNGAYIREGNTNRKITDNEFRTYVASSKEFQYDLSEALNTEKSDLSERKIKFLLNKREDDVRRGAALRIDDDLLQNLGLIGKFDDDLKPTIAGFLNFAKQYPQNQYPFERYIVRCVKYAGNNPASEIIDQRDIKGTLDEQIEETYKFILKNIRKSALIIGTRRIERFEYPEEALRELIANALIHRDYKITETYTQITIFDDRIEISNPGSLPPGVTIDNIKDAQFSRNPVIAARLKDMDYLEEYGRGIDIVIDKMAEWGLQSPLFRNHVNSFQVILLGRKYRKLNYRQLHIINSLLIKGKITAKDCARILKGAPRPTINKDLSDLKRLKIIISQGASTNTFYVLSF